MKKPFRYITPLFLLFLSGCQTYSAVSNFNNNEIYAKALHSTKKIDIIEDNKIKLMFTVTYLNEVYMQEDKSFILSLFEVDSTKPINKNLIEASLNNKNLLSISKLEKDHKMYNNLVYKNPWAKSFIIRFKNNKEKKQELKLKYKDSKSALFTF